MKTFQDLGIAGTILRAVEAEGYTHPTPIQAQAIPYLMEGRDLLGIAQTGTGKTAAFALPILTHLLKERLPSKPRRVRVLVMAPTRELAAQIAESFKTYGRHAQVQVATVFGGVSYGPQVRALGRGLDVLVATPGRLLDLIDQGSVRLNETDYVVLDEADHMLDLGFIVPIRKIIGLLPKKRQTLLFSATMPKEIAGLAGDMLKNPAQVAIKPEGTTAERVEQKVFKVPGGSKNDLLSHLLQQSEFERTLIFTRTKHGADKVCKMLGKINVAAAAIHGNKSQAQREKALAGFKKGSTRVLVATDIAARGIDVDMVSHVINYELPDVAETYVHRIGRTARAGAGGQAIAFCDASERSNLRAIERLTRQKIPAFSWSADDGIAQVDDTYDHGERDAPPAGRRGSNRPKTERRRARNKPPAGRSSARKNISAGGHEKADGPPKKSSGNMSPNRKSPAKKPGFKSRTANAENGGGAAAGKKHKAGHNGARPEARQKPSAAGSPAEVKGAGRKPNRAGQRRRRRMREEALAAAAQV